jgi:YgiT-type zinc finger domain-containing protein
MWPGKTVAALNRGEMVIAIKAVPAMICDACGEYYLDAETTEKVAARCEDAMRRGVEIEVANFGQ